MPLLGNKNLIVRALSGSVYISLILWVLLSKSGIPFLALFSLLAVVAVHEFNNLTRVYRLFPFRIVLDYCVVVWLILMGYFISTGKYGLTVWIPLIAYLLLVLSRSIFSDEKCALKGINNSLFPIIYIGIPFFLAALLSFRSDPFSEHFTGFRVLSVFMIVWANDTGAYLTGTFFGKRPLYSKLSPKKTMEGLFGGLLFAVVMSAFLPLIFPSTFGVYSVWVMAFYGLLIGLLAVLGDFFESMLKRRANTKDSGKLIPGHGGVLDRIDSFLFAMPVAFIVTAALYPL